MPLIPIEQLNGACPQFPRHDPSGTLRCLGTSPGDPTVSVFGNPKVEAVFLTHPRVQHQDHNRAQESRRCLNQLPDLLDREWLGFLVVTAEPVSPGVERREARDQLLFDKPADECSGEEEPLPFVADAAVRSLHRLVPFEPLGCVERADGRTGVNKHLEGIETQPDGIVGGHRDIAGLDLGRSHGKVFVNPVPRPAGPLLRGKYSLFEGGHAGPVPGPLAGPGPSRHLGRDGQPGQPPGQPRDLDRSEAGRGVRARQHRRPAGPARRFDDRPRSLRPARPPRGAVEIHPGRPGPGHPGPFVLEFILTALAG